MLRGCLYGLGNRNREVPIAVQDVSRAEHRQANDAAGAGRIADDVALWRLLALGWLGRADMQVEHVTIRVVVGVIEAQRPDRDVYALHDLGSFRLANAETIRAGVCS